MVTLCMVGKNFSRGHFEIFFSYFSQKKGFDISCRSSPETICMKCQCLISKKNKKNLINLSFAVLAQRVVKVNMLVLNLVMKKKICSRNDSVNSSHYRQWIFERLRQ